MDGENDMNSCLNGTFFSFFLLICFFIAWETLCAILLLVCPLKGPQWPFNIHTLTYT